MWWSTSARRWSAGSSCSARTTATYVSDGAGLDVGTARARSGSRRPRTVRRHRETASRCAVVRTRPPDGRTCRGSAGATTRGRTPPGRSPGPHRRRRSGRRPARPGAGTPRRTARRTPARPPGQPLLGGVSVEVRPAGSAGCIRPTVASVTDMTYRPLGDSGPTVSAVGVGCNAFSRRVDQDGVADILAAAREVGVTLLDTADVYGATPRGERGDARDRPAGAA